MNMTNDLLHEKRGEKKRQIKFPKGKKDTEDPKNRTRTKTNRAKTKRHKKTRKTSTKRPRRRGGGNGSLENFNLNFTISAGKHLQHHLHHRLKKNGEEKRPSRTTPSTWTRPSGTEIRSRRAAKITNVQLKFTPGNSHFRHPSSNSRACVCPAPIARGCSVAGRESVTPSVTTTFPSTTQRIGRRPC